MDMAGNVWELMENYYDADERVRALRGGSWHINDLALRCSARNCLRPVINWNNGRGFRVAASPQS
jgi:formylglycine-generating enzyme required for sulfatase activity